MGRWGWGDGEVEVYIWKCGSQVPPFLPSNSLLGAGVRKCGNTLAPPSCGAGGYRGYEGRGGACCSGEGEGAGGG